MDSCGCGGARGTGVQENKANRDTDDHAGHAWYVMAGKISPKKTCVCRHGGGTDGYSSSSSSRKIVLEVEISTVVATVTAEISSSNSSNNSSSRK